MKRFLITATIVLLSTTVLAVQPGERLADPVKEARAREVSQALRCVVCQNETIDDSEAELAKDMRILVRERISAGDSNEQVISYMVQRYGDFVLLKPRMTADTMALWFGPFVLLIVGAFVVARRLRRPATQVAEAVILSDAEAREVQALKERAP